jgi:hypothetical protein
MSSTNRAGILKLTRRERANIKLLLEHVQKELDLNDWQYHKHAGELNMITAPKITEAISDIKFIIDNFTN